MKISKRDIQLLYVLGGILMIFFCYQFIFRGLCSKAEELRSENSSLNLKIAELEALEVERDFFEEETKRMDSYNEKIIEVFPAGFRAEDGILYASELETNSSIEIPSVALGNDELIHALGQGEEEVTNKSNIALHKTSLGLSYKASYFSLKDALDYINKDAERRTVESLSASYDNSTGVLQGTINMNVYSLVGTGKEYTQPNLNDIRIGTSNIFKSLAID